LGCEISNVTTPPRFNLNFTLDKKKRSWNIINYNKGVRMARVSTYLNFNGNAEEAFTFYRSVFGTDFVGPINRMGDVPDDPSMPAVPEAQKNLVMHIELPILAGHVIMATDIVESMDQQLRIGNNTTINLEPDSREETDRLYIELSTGGSDASGMHDMFWGAYWGTCLDRFGVRWMFNFVTAGS
jgi:PhnB protein